MDISNCRLWDEVLKPKYKDDILQVTGVTPKTYLVWKSGDNLPNIYALLKIAEYFKTNISFCIGLTSDRSANLTYKTGSDFQRLTLLRKQNNLSKLSLQEATGLTAKTLYLYENDGPTQLLGTNLKLAEYFNVSIDYLLGLRDDRSFTNNRIDYLKANTLLKITEDDGEENLALVDSKGNIHSGNGKTFSYKDLRNLCYTILDTENL